MKKLVIALLLSGAAATPALAAPAEVGGFQGGRVEVRAGWDKVKLDGQFSIATPALSVSDQSSESGFGFGIEGGYDFQVGSSVVVGGYVGLDFSSSDFCSTVFVDARACLQAGRDWSVGLRAGFPVADTALLYIKGGYSNGKLKGSFDDANGFVTVNPPLVSPVAIADFDSSRHAGGIHFGFGGEMNFGEMFYGKLEFVHTNYGNGNFDAQNVHLDLDAKRNRFLLGAGIRF